ncbi:MAG TPA: selenocysteine-specific translation elongation factor [Gemmatimonadales bacterium]|nr:selenocysteine-specific translation elongation factor [Gemmatimonadales bacterium]
MRFVVGTAGHIDHGKTALVKALTGVDTDRWEEEKRRGITIDLGFAPLPLGAGLEVSVVDVPGHEGFVRNMLAGATGIDVALLVIAADEGIMPQTEEHLAILELLGIPRGIPVVTKTDLVDQEWLALVVGEVTERLRRSVIQWRAPVPVSAQTGAGLDQLRAVLEDVGHEVLDRPEEDLFRLPIDRVFALPGAGTVVTGTTWSGSAAVGDFVHVLPLGRNVRVRSIEVHGKPAERALPGRRTALALVGVSKEELARGAVAVRGTGWRTTRRLDAQVEVLAHAARPLRGRTRVRVHLGTAEVLARVIQIGAVEPGTRAVARLVLESPLVARGGDRFVLRSFSPVTTIGGGVVLDPFPPARGKVRHRTLIAEQSAADRLRVLLREAGLGGLTAAELPVRLGLRPDELPAVLAATEAEHVGADGLLVAVTAVEQAIVRVRDDLARHHERNPLDSGMSLESIRSGLGENGRTTGVADLVLLAGVRSGAWEVDGGVARAPGWKPKLDARASAARSKVLHILKTARWEIPTTAELERQVNGGSSLGPLLALLAREGIVQQIDQERYGDPGALTEFRARIEALLGELGEATPAALRDRLGLTRKYLIPLLEWMDRRGITERHGDARRLLTPRTAGP